MPLNYWLDLKIATTRWFANWHFCIWV